MSDSGGQWGAGPGGQPPYPPQGWGAPPPGPGPAPDHPNATTSLVLGILGLVLCQLLAPVAWVIGKRARDEIDSSGGRYGGRGSAQAGYVMGVIGTVLMAAALLFVLGVLLLGGLLAGTSTSP